MGDRGEERARGEAFNLNGQVITRASNLGLIEIEDGRKQPIRDVLKAFFNQSSGMKMDLFVWEMLK